MYQIQREMPAKELAGWYAHVKLSAEEREREQARADRMAGRM